MCCYEDVLTPITVILNRTAIAKKRAGEEERRAHISVVKLPMHHIKIAAMHLRMTTDALLELYRRLP